MRALFAAFALVVLLTACDPSTHSPAPSETGPRALRTPLEFRVVRDVAPGRCPAGLVAPSGGALLPYADTCLAVDAPGLTVDRVTSFEVASDASGRVAGTGWHVGATMLPEQREAWARFTDSAVSSQVAIVVGGTVYSTPTIQEPIQDGSFQISFDDEASARALATRLTGSSS